MLKKNGQIKLVGSRPSPTTKNVGFPDCFARKMARITAASKSLAEIEERAKAEREKDSTAEPV